MKKILLLLACCVVFTLVVACGDTTGPKVNNPNTVKLLAASFAVPSITIKKGETITFVDDAGNGSLHILTIGKLGIQENEAGAPDFGGLGGMRVDLGESWTSPPWNVAGTFHLTCTSHPATMDMTVIVM